MTSQQRTKLLMLFNCLVLTPDLTKEQYHAKRNEANRLPGVDIRSLPRDEEFGYEPEMMELN